MADAGTEKLINKIIDEAQEDAKQIKADAEKRADAIISDANSEAEKIKREAEKTADDYDNEQLLRTKSNAQLDAKKEELKKRHDIVDETFAKVRKQLDSMTQDECRDFFKAIILRETDGGECILPSAKHREMLEKLLPELNEIQLSEKEVGLSLGETREDILDGFIILGMGYTKTCTIDAILSDFKEKEIGSVWAILGK